MTDTAKQATPETVCEWCGPRCYRGAEHNARVEDNARYTDEPAVVPAQSAPTPGRYCNCPRNMPYYDWSHDPSCYLYVELKPIPPTSAPGSEGERHAFIGALVAENADLRDEVADLKRKLAEAERKGWNNCIKFCSETIRDIRGRKTNQYIAEVIESAEKVTK